MISIVFGFFGLTIIVGMLLAAPDIMSKILSVYTTFFSDAANLHFEFGELVIFAFFTLMLSIAPLCLLSAVLVWREYRFNRMFGIITACLLIPAFPFGTAFGIYAIIILSNMKTVKGNRDK